MQKVLKEPSFFALFLLISFTSVSAILFTPGLPEIAQHLGISKAKAQSTISIFLLGYTFSLLLYGPLSNRIGRKPAASLGISIAILGCLVTLLVEKFHSFSLLITGRLLMALGSSVGLKIAFTLIGDIYRDDKATKKIASLLPSFAIMPAIAVAIGGVLTHQFGWLSCFYFQTFYSIFVLFVVFSLPETCLYKDPQALQSKIIVRGYLAALKNKRLPFCALLMGLGVSMIYLFATEAPFIAINTIGLSPKTYGFLNFIPSIGLVLGSISANLLAGKKAQQSILLGGIFVSFIFAILMLALFLFGLIDPWTLFIPVLLIYFGEAVVYANASSLALSHADNKSYASATMSFITMGSAFLVILIFQSFGTHTPAIMPLIFTLTALLMFIFSRILNIITNK